MFPRLDPVAQARTTEWIVTAFRFLCLVVFAVIGLVSPPPTSASLHTLYLFILLGFLYSLYVSLVLHRGITTATLPHHLSFFLACDMLLLVALAYFSNLFQEGLLFFYLILIIVVALRASLTNSLFLGGVMVLAYYLSSLLISEGTPNLRRFFLDAAGLVALSAACGWFAEGKSRAWRLAAHLGERMESVSSELVEAKRELEILRRLQEMQRDFLAVMSHELRTPLTGIIGYSDLMLLGEVGEITPAQRELIAEIMKKGIDLLNLIDNILNIHKIRSGRWKLRLEPVLPTALADECLSTVHPDAVRKGITVIHDPLSREKLVSINADGQKVKLVLLNILANAIRYTPPGGTVRVREELRTDTTLEERFPHLISSSQVVSFTVTDSGPGVNLEDLPHIFEMFYHGQGAENFTTTSRMGLGLAVSREIIELHWGKIWYERPEGGGSRFCFTLPVNPLRLRSKIALVRSRFNVELLLTGLLVQFDGEIREKRLTVEHQGWPTEGGAPFMVTADRQLLQSVFFNVLNNKIRYAYPGSEIAVVIEGGRNGTPILFRIVNRGDMIRSSVIEEINRGEGGENGEGTEGDLRQVNVNLAMARDIIESHGGTFTLQNLENQATAVVIVIPAAGPEEGGGGHHEEAPDTDRRG